VSDVAVGCYFEMDNSWYGIWRLTRGGMKNGSVLWVPEFEHRPIVRRIQSNVYTLGVRCGMLH